MSEPYITSYQTRKVGVGKWEVWTANSDVLVGTITRTGFIPPFLYEFGSNPLAAPGKAQGSSTSREAAGYLLATWHHSRSRPW